MTRLVILDRDGVINHDSDNYIRNATEWKPIDGSIEAISLLTSAGFTVAIATNQAGIAKGVIAEADLNSIHNKLVEVVKSGGGDIKQVYVCTHHPDEKCNCRKPRPGMLEAACADFGVPPQLVPFVGDSLRDIQAAMAAGCRPVLVLSGNGRKTRETEHLPSSLEVFEDLLDFAKHYTA